MPLKIVKRNAADRKDNNCGWIDRGNNRDHRLFCG